MDDLDFIAPPSGYSAFQSNLPRAYFRLIDDVKRGDPVTEFNIQIMEDK